MISRPLNYWLNISGKLPLNHRRSRRTSGGGKRRKKSKARKSGPNADGTTSPASAGRQSENSQASSSSSNRVNPGERSDYDENWEEEWGDDDEMSRVRNSSSATRVGSGVPLRVVEYPRYASL